MHLAGLPAPRAPLRERPSSHPPMRYLRTGLTAALAAVTGVSAYCWYADYAHRSAAHVCHEHSFCNVTVEGCSVLFAFAGPHRRALPQTPKPGLVRA